jgi:hypothetical protein
LSKFAHLRREYTGILTKVSAAAMMRDEREVCPPSPSSKKGVSLIALLMMFKFLPQPEPWARLPFAAPEPVWILSSADRPHNADALTNAD